MVRLENILKKYLEKISWRRLKDFLKTFLQDVLKTFWRRFEDVLNTSCRRLQNVFNTFLQDILKTFRRRLEDVFKTSSRFLQNFLKTFLQDVFKTSWKRLENVLKTSWRRMAKRNILVLTKTSSEDVRLRRTYSSRSRRLEDVFPEDEDKRRLQGLFIKTTVCWGRSEKLLKIHW